MMLFRRTLLLPFLLACSETAAPPDSLIPSPPDGVLTGARTQEITISWHDRSTNETSFRVEVRGEDGSWTLLAETAANTTSVAHSGVLHGVAYRYRVAACNAAGCSPWVETGGKWDTAAPPEITLVRAVGIDTTRATFEARGYSGGLPTRFIFTVRKQGDPVPLFQSEPITAVAVGATGEGGYPVLASLTYFALEVGTTYELSATASNNVGAAAPIAPHTFRTLGPGAPTLSQSTTLIQDGSATLTVRVATGSLATELRFEVALAGPVFTAAHASQPVVIGPNAATATASTSFTLAAGSYQWRAVATNSKGTAQSAPMAFVIP